MKKFFGIAAAGLLMFGLAGQANAAFINGDLIRVVYQTGASGTIEQVSDLGNAATELALTGQIGDTVNLYTGGNLISSEGGTAASFSSGVLSSLAVAYFAYDSTGTKTTFTSGLSGPSGTQSINHSQFNTATGSMTSIYSLYTGVPADVWGLKSNTLSYFFKLDSNALASAGKMGGLYATGAFNGEASLASGSATQGIYETPGTGGNIPALAPSLNILTSVDANGNLTTTIEGGPATPIPPSVLLFGSGLLGLIGIRRKNFSL